ncbi:MAG TPA: NUDIX hydrolase [Steroidobacteraceae bacterium]|nr:NUDIX hydrolase [Steroidobacteraceae bacterium]
MSDPDWLGWAKQLAALAQTGLAFSHNDFDRERYAAVQEIAAAMLAAGSGLPPEPLQALLGAETGYATPKVDVRAAVFRDDRILLVRERSDGRWTLPGGWADVGDSPHQAAEREVREESGYEVRARKLAAVFDRNRHAHTVHAFHIWKLFFICELTGGQPRESIETDGVEFFALDALPQLSTGRVTAAQIAHMYEHYRDPQRATSFD